MSILEKLAGNILNGLFRTRIKGLEKLDFSGPVILAPNHVSLWDAVLLGINLPDDVVFVVNTEIAKQLGSILNIRKHITIDPLNSYSMRKILREVKRGKPLLIFPEGRITTTGTIMKIYSGLGYIAMRTGAKIYPISITGLERSKLSYMSDKWKTHWFPQVGITIGDPYLIERKEDVPKRILKEQATQQILRTMQRELFAARQKNEVNLFNEMLEAAKLNGPKMQIVEDISSKVNYKNLILASYVLGGKFASMLGPEKNVGTLLPSAIGHIATLFGLFYVGKTPVVLNFTMGPQNLLDACETAGIKTVLTSREFVEKGKMEPLIEALQTTTQVLYLEDIRATVGTGDKLTALTNYLFKKKSTSTDNEVILFTSGSEAKAKGVVLSHANIYNNILQVRTMIDVTAKDKLLNVLPMFHSFGLTVGTFLPVIGGLPVFTYPSPLHYKVIPEIAYDRNCTVLCGTSTFLAGYARMAKPYDFYSMRYVLAGAEKLKDEVRQLYMDKFGIRILEGYGATETGPILSLNSPLSTKRGTVGQFLPGIDYHLEQIPGIDQGGNLQVKGPNVMKGYLLHEKGFVPAGEYYDTGDIVHIDDEEFITIVGRKKRFAKIAGEMIPLNLIEQLAGQRFDDPNFAAVNLPDARRGERVILYTSNTEATLTQLKDYIREKGYSPLLIPYKLVAVKDLPLLGSGKTDYVTLKAWAEEQS
ncbi:AMP-binding protein [Brevibacillus dissolubilis]|uniref:AMP-binding protein n=1 Tax=Brevibacillus dissolubilis TaxID=1844116 RepID=UPI0021005479|nr:AMP-binding protein [Brevibacillus dissolubilis]